MLSHVTTLAPAYHCPSPNVMRRPEPSETVFNVASSPTQTAADQPKRYGLPTLWTTPDGLLIPLSA
jgi:hypothetical protein